MDAQTEEVRKHVRVYISVFVALMVLTVVTVAVSYLHLAIALAVAAALTIAVVKASLVASFFMHLVNEKKLIYWALILTAAFLVFLFGLPMLGHVNQVGTPGGQFHVSGGSAPTH